MSVINGLIILTQGHELTKIEETMCTLQDGTLDLELAESSIQHQLTL